MGQQQIGPDLELIIKDMQRRLRDLEVAPRVPQVSSSQRNLKTDRDTTGLVGTAGTSWGGLGGGVHAPSVDIVVPQSRRIFCHFGAFLGVSTSTSPNQYEMVTMGVQIPLNHSAIQDEGASLYVVNPSTIVNANVANGLVIEVLDPAQPGDTVTVDTVYSHLNSNVAVSHFVKYPWLIVQPL